ncbi:hypothetical protein SAMN04488038_108106 [Solimonas aquatica]|uniref:Toxin CptA n=1 Tax=Solimonas aquatica TaxID=489703 RepID=A0A1H9HBV3_9GAMM|nr:protein YgfX [Solimonas aquatica]SEQ59747.1 hypothetical protein SAMN04488038_108106 [Solimonas aquatica]
MNKASGMTLDLRLKPSLAALQLVFLLHIGVIAALPFALRPGLPLMVLLAAAAASWFWLRRHPMLGFGPRAIERIVWHENGDWQVYRGGREQSVQLQAGSLVHSHLLVLNFRGEDGRRCSRLILGGEAEAEPLRRLRARLRLAKAD